MDIAQLVTPMMESLKDTIIEVITLSLPYIMMILAVTIALPWGLNKIQEWIFGKRVSPYMEQEISFGHSFYDEEGNLDAIGYGDMDDYYSGDYDDMLEAGVEDLEDNDMMGFYEYELQHMHDDIIFDNDHGYPSDDFSDEGQFDFEDILWENETEWAEKHANEHWTGEEWVPDEDDEEPDESDDGGGFD